MKIERIDHLVLTVRDVEATCAFYQRTLGMEAVTFDGHRRALSFGRQKINLHPAEAPLPPHAKHPQSGSADLCFITSSTVAELISHLWKEDITILQGPVTRTGALGPMTSVYFRDPDENLIEVSVYEHAFSFT